MQSEIEDIIISVSNTCLSRPYLQKEYNQTNKEVNLPLIVKQEYPDIYIPYVLPYVSESVIKHEFNKKNICFIHDIKFENPQIQLSNYKTAILKVLFWYDNETANNIRNTLNQYIPYDYIYEHPENKYETITLKLFKNTNIIKPSLTYKQNQENRENQENQENQTHIQTINNNKIKISESKSPFDIIYNIFELKILQEHLENPLSYYPKIWYFYTHTKNTTLNISELMEEYILYHVKNYDITKVFDFFMILVKEGGASIKDIIELSKQTIISPESTHYQYIDRTTTINNLYFYISTHDHIVTYAIYKGLCLEYSDLPVLDLSVDFFSNYIKACCDFILNKDIIRAIDIVEGIKESVSIQYIKLLSQEQQLLISSKLLSYGVEPSEIITIFNLQTDNILSFENSININITMDKSNIKNKIFMRILAWYSLHNNT